MLFDVLTVSSVLSVPRVCLELFKNDSDQTGSQPRSSVIGHRSSSVRPSVRCSSESSCSSYLSSIVYRLSGILRTLRTLRSLRSLRPRVVYLAIAHPSAADIATLQSVSTSAPARRSPYQRSRVIMIRGEEKTGGREREDDRSGARRRESEKAKGRRMENTGPGIREGERGPRAVITDASRSR